MSVPLHPAAHSPQSLDVYHRRIETFLKTVLPREETEPQHLHQAMRYSVLNGGKRLRPLLVYASGAIFNADLTALDHCAAAVELIHAYSLIHDDLPAMDDDDWRRGQPSCHKAFDEATAILAGDALQSLAFELLSEKLPNVALQTQLAMLSVLAQASGSRGMAGGQALDLQPKHPLNLQRIQEIHRLKTGALMLACVRLGALAAADCSLAERHELETFAHCFGLAFQIQDDILDQGELLEDAASKKDSLNYLAHTSLSAAEHEVAALYDRALQALQRLKKPADLLVTLTNQFMASDA